MRRMSGMRAVYSRRGFRSGRMARPGISGTWYLLIKDSTHAMDFHAGRPGPRRLRRGIAGRRPPRRPFRPGPGAGRLAAEPGATERAPTQADERIRRTLRARHRGHPPAPAARGAPGAGHSRKRSRAGRRHRPAARRHASRSSRRGCPAAGLGHRAAGRRGCAASASSPEPVQPVERQPAPRPAPSPRRVAPRQRLHANLRWSSAASPQPRAGCSAATRYCASAWCCCSSAWPSSCAMPRNG